MDLPLNIECFLFLRTVSTQPCSFWTDLYRYIDLEPNTCMLPTPAPSCLRLPAAALLSQSNCLTKGIDRKIHLDSSVNSSCGPGITAQHGTDPPGCRKTPRLRPHHRPKPRSSGCCFCTAPTHESSSAAQAVSTIKEELLAAIQGTDRGIAGVQVLNRAASIRHQ